MAGLKQKTAIVLASGVIAVGLFHTFQPPSGGSQEDRDKQSREQQVNDLADGQERVSEQLRDEGRAQGDAEYGRRLVPGEYRPKLRLPFRP
jgi:hypothetical protein